MQEGSQNLLYFAYGEHMNETEMKQTFPDARMVGLTRLPGYSLCFVGRDGMARAAVEPNSSASVPGREWSLSEAHADALDKIADDPYFARREIRMVTLGDMKLPVLVYITAPGQARGRPGFVTYDVMREAYESAGEDVEALKRLAMQSKP